MAQANDRALDAIVKACDCYKEMRSLYQAGKMLEQAVLISRDMQQLDKIGGFAERGALLYRQGKFNQNLNVLCYRKGSFTLATFVGNNANDNTSNSDTLVLAMATLGSTTKLEMILSVSCCPRWAKASSWLSLSCRCFWCWCYRAYFANGNAA